MDDFRMQPEKALEKMEWDPKQLSKIDDQT